jgi:hypothetical protein
MSHKAHAHRNRGATRTAGGMASSGMYLDRRQTKPLWGGARNKNDPDEDSDVDEEEEISRYHPRYNDNVYLHDNRLREAEREVYRRELALQKVLDDWKHGTGQTRWWDDFNELRGYKTEDLQKAKEKLTKAQANLKKAKGPPLSLYQLAKNSLENEIRKADSQMQRDLQNPPYNLYRPEAYQKYIEEKREEIAKHEKSELGIVELFEETAKSYQQEYEERRRVEEHDRENNLPIDEPNLRWMNELKILAENWRQRAAAHRAQVGQDSYTIRRLEDIEDLERVKHKSETSPPYKEYMLLYNNLEDYFKAYPDPQRAKSEIDQRNKQRRQAVRHIRKEEERLLAGPDYSIADYFEQLAKQDPDPIMRLRYGERAREEIQKADAKAITEIGALARFTVEATDRTTPGRPLSFNLDLINPTLNQIQKQKMIQQQQAAEQAAEKAREDAEMAARLQHEEEMHRKALEWQSHLRALNLREVELNEQRLQQPTATLTQGTIGIQLERERQARREADRERNERELVRSRSINNNNNNNNQFTGRGTVFGYMYHQKFKKRK